MTEKYLDTKELCEIIKYKPQSVYNLINKGELVLGKHYLKPSSKKLVFIYSAILEWMGEGRGEIGDLPIDLASEDEEKCLVNI